MTIRRMKTYTGGQGYVYQYYFVGKRPSLPTVAQAPATEYVFDVTSDRKTMFAVSVFLPQDVLAAWVSGHGRSLTEAEEYAAAKMRLFRAFDSIERFESARRDIVVDAENIEDLLAPLDIG